VKLHDLRPAAGSRRPRTRVGRGIAAGQGKTAGRGTKGQKSRTGVSIPAWFEGGQTPIHIRVPKLRGFKRRFRVEYAIVNVGQISAYAEAGRFGVELDAPKPARGKAGDQAVATVNAELLASAGLIRDLGKPVKVLGQGEVTQKLFVAADAFSTSARRKIEDAGGFVQVLAPEEPAAVTEAMAEPGSVAETSRKRKAVAEPPVAEAAEPEASAEPPAAAAAEPEASAEPAAAEPAETAVGQVSDPEQAAESGPTAESVPAAEPEQAVEPVPVPEPAKKASRRRSAPKKDGDAS